MDIMFLRPDRHLPNCKMPQEFGKWIEVEMMRDDRLLQGSSTKTEIVSRAAAAPDLNCRNAFNNDTTSAPVFNNLEPTFSAFNPFYIVRTVASCVSCQSTP
jgi:hypothetical protein